MKAAVVTGGGRGIGRGIVLELAARGFGVLVNYRGDEEAAGACCRLALERGAPEALAARADISDPDSGRGLVDVALARFGRIDLWVNNAGVAPESRRDLLEMTAESFDRVVGTNLRGPVLLTQRVARAMLDQVPGGPAPPAIVFVTSVSSAMASTNRAEYCISKAGLSMAAALFACRLAEHGLPVFEVRPGIIATDMTAGVREAYDRRIADGLAPARRWGTPEDVGRVVGLIADGAFGYSTGQVFHVDGGLHLPRL
jgi:NAD(P)-dependent dehydrogenase (short-subunit alcohol dehydrogenase family)